MCFKGLRQWQAVVRHHEHRKQSSIIQAQLSWPYEEALETWSSGTSLWVGQGWPQPNFSTNILKTHTHFCMTYFVITDIPFSGEKSVLEHLLKKKKSCLSPCYHYNKRINSVFVLLGHVSTLVPVFKCKTYWTSVIYKLESLNIFLVFSFS